MPFFPIGLIGLLTIPIAALAFAEWWIARDVVLFGDTRWYASGLDRLLAAGPLYDPAKLLPHSLAGEPFWDQAPSLAPLTLVLALEHGELLFGGLMVLSMVAGLIVIWPRLGPGGTLLAAPVILLWEPVASALVWANVNALVFLLLAVAFRFPRAAGAAIGLAAAAKLVPIIGVAWLAGRRDWRGVAIAVSIPVVATLLVSLWKGPSTVADFVSLRLAQGVGGSEGWLTLLGEYLPAIALTVLAYWRASFGLAVLAMVAAIPVLYLHYLTWLLVPAIGIWIPWVITKLNSPHPLDWLLPWVPHGRYPSSEAFRNR